MADKMIKSGQDCLHYVFGMYELNKMISSYGKQ